MKLVQESPIPVVELTRRNLNVLLAKLDDPDSRKTLIAQADGRETCAIRAVEDIEHYADRAPGIMFVDGEYLL